MRQQPVCCIVAGVLHMHHSLKILATQASVVDMRMGLYKHASSLSIEGGAICYDDGLYRDRPGNTVYAAHERVGLLMWFVCSDSPVCHRASTDRTIASTRVDGTVLMRPCGQADLVDLARAVVAGLVAPDGVPPPCAPNLLSPPPPRLMMSPPISAAPAEHQESEVTPAQVCHTLASGQATTNCAQVSRYSRNANESGRRARAPAAALFTRSVPPHLPLPSSGHKKLCFWRLSNSRTKHARAHLSHCGQHCWLHCTLPPRCKSGLVPRCHRICGQSSGSCCTCSHAHNLLSTRHKHKTAMR